MKKVISLFLILSLLFTLFGCTTTVQEETAAADVLVQEQKTEQPPKTVVKTEQQLENTNKQQINKTDTTNDKASYCDVTIDEPFSANEVVISLTLEESAKKKSYTPDDFSQVDIFHVFEFNYYPTEYHPEYEGRTTLMLMLNDPSKERVLEYVKVLEKDERIYSAEPNFITDIYNNECDSCLVNLTEQELVKNKTYTINDFEYADIISVKEQNKEYIYQITGERIVKKELIISYVKNNNKTLKDLVNDNRVSSLRPNYLEIEPNCIYVTLTEQEHEKGEKYTIKDFSEINIEKIDSYASSKIINIHLKQGGYREVFSVYHNLKNDKRFASVEFNNTLTLIPYYPTVITP